MNAVRGGSTSGVALTLNGLNGKFDDALSSALGAGDAAGSGWGGFFAGTYTNADRDSTDRESRYNTDMWGVTGGIDNQSTRIAVRRSDAALMPIHVNRGKRFVEEL